MSKYPNSSIYKLVLGDEVYYGSTTEALSRRFYKHKYLYSRYKKGEIKKKCSSFILFEKDLENVKCELVELYPCDNRIDLHKRERFYIENNPCINVMVPTRTRAEYNKQFPDKVKAQRTKWVEANREYTRQQQNTRVECECGGSYTKANKVVHMKSKKHSKKLELKNK
jgi:hypothetical protein